MQTHQAIVYSCDEENTKSTLVQYIERDLNLYAIDYIMNPLGLKALLEDSEERNQVFAKFDNCFQEHNAQRILIFSHSGCPDLGGATFESVEEERRERELKLRHVISVVQSKYPDKLVEAYLAEGEDPEVMFNKVV